MEERRMPLDEVTVLESLHVRDLLRFRDVNEPAQERPTLGSVLKMDDDGQGHSLIDLINGSSSPIVLRPSSNTVWRSFIHRLKFRRSTALWWRIPASRSAEESTAPVASEERTARRTGTNLATALAAEQESEVGPSGRMSLMALLETSSDGQVVVGPERSMAERMLHEWDGEDECGDDGGDGGQAGCCCVCMVRRKGAAFIPCGHTFCRACSGELWLSRGSCPLCNAFIVEILRIF